jgi:hypothetical protein
MYDKQLDSGKGTLLHLCDDVIQQEVLNHLALVNAMCNMFCMCHLFSQTPCQVKEVIVSYYILMEQGKATIQVSVQLGPVSALYILFLSVLFLPLIISNGSFTQRWHVFCEF